MGERSTWRGGVIFDEGVRSFLDRRVKVVGVWVKILLLLVLLVLGVSVWFAVEETRKKPGVWGGGEVEGVAVGSGLSHESQTDDGWSYRLDVEEIKAEGGEGGGLFGLARLREARVTIFGEGVEESLVFYAPDVLWREAEGLFHMKGGCRVWQGGQLDIKAEEIIVDVKRRKVEIPGALKGRYGEGWFFEASSGRWDIAKDHLVLQGVMTLGKQGESL